MRMNIGIATAVAFLLLAATNGSAHLETRSANLPTGELVPGTEYSLDCTGYVHCAVMGPAEGAGVEYHEGQVLTVTIGNVGAPLEVGPEWLNTSSRDFTLSMSDCGQEGFDVGTPGPKIVLKDTLTFTVSERAPAFTEFSFQPGALGENNQGGNFNASIAYLPEFTAPKAIQFEAVGGAATATIPLTSAANADSIFNFEVTQFTVDGESAPEHAMAHIQQSLEMETGIFTDEGVTSGSVDLHFGIGDMDHEEGHEEDHDEDHEAEHHEEVDHETHFHWESAQVILSVTLAAVEDEAQVSEPYSVVLTFVNADEESMPHEVDEEGSRLLPGYGALAAVGAVASVALLRRRI